MGEVLFTEHPLSLETGHFFLPAARAELKSATSLPDAGISDCRVRRVGEAGSNGRESNSCMHTCAQVLHALLIVSHPFWTAFHVLPLDIFSFSQDVVRRPDPGNIVHISGVHQQLLLRMESQPDFSRVMGTYTG